MGSPGTIDISEGTPGIWGILGSHESTFLTSGLVKRCHRLDTNAI